VRLIDEDRSYLIYKPETYEAMNCIIFNYWCTIDRKEWDKYRNSGYDIWVYYDKNDITNSYMLLSRDDDFYVSDYNNDTLFTDEDYEDVIDNIPPEAYKLVNVIADVDTNMKHLLPTF
jgi:hypothetical protein